MWCKLVLGVNAEPATLMQLFNKNNFLGRIIHVCVLYVFCYGIAIAQNIVVDKGQEEPKPRWLVLPYAFYTESLQFAYGVGGGTSGYLQPQMASFLALMGTTNDSAAAFLAIMDYQVPFARRMFFDVKGSLGYYTDSRIYAGYNPDFPDERSGSNESSNDNYQQGADSDDWIDLKFKYLLPLGHAKSKAINTYTLADGLLVDGATGGDVWNPKISGRTNFETIFFYRDREFLTETNELEGKTNGVKFALEYDNRNFRTNPSNGSLQRFEYSGDFGWFNSSDDWRSMNLDLRKYIPFGHTKHIRQQVLALNYWTAYSPSWEEIQTTEGPFIDGHVPSYLGASLGGFYRLRAYPTYRFSDKAAVFYAAEYRMIPRANPLGELKWLKFLDIDWWQFVPFVELGRVAPSWNFKELHTDMKWDVGMGFRFMAERAVFRIDTAFTDGAWSTWAMVGHPF